MDPALRRCDTRRVWYLRGVLEHVHAVGKSVRVRRMGFRALARAAQGELPCSLLLRNVKLLNVRTAEIMENTNVGGYGERVADIGEEERPAASRHERKGKYAS